MRVRIRFTKHGKVRFTSHRDVARIWERTFRKAGIALAYSEGFSPRPKLHFGLALSTGHESDAEFLDADLPDAPTAEEVASLPARLSSCLPVGMEATGAALVEAGADSLQQSVTVCRWVIEAVGIPAAEVAAALGRLLAADEVLLTRQRKGKDTTDDIRPYVVRLEVGPTTERGVLLIAELGTQPRGLRPNELLRALHPAVEEGLVTRTHQWIEHDGERCEPAEGSPPGLGAAPPQPVAVGASHAEARAS